MFKFFDRSGVEVFSSSDLEEVENKAKEYMLKNNIRNLELCRENGTFYKWISS